MKLTDQLTCSQRRWLHRSVGRTSHRYRKFTGSNPVEVLNFFSGFFTQLHKLCSLRRSFLHFHFISFPQFIHDLFQISLTKNIIILINAKKPMMAFFTLLTVNVCSCVPWNASIRWMTPPLADSKIILPSELNFTPVHSMLGSFWIWKVENGPCENRWKKKESA